MEQTEETHRPSYIFHDLPEEQRTQCIAQKTFYLKNGDVIVREYNQTEWNSRWYKKNKERMTTSDVCVCGGKFSPNNKFKHYNTKMHKQHMATINV